MGDDQVVARELEQAEARLVEAREEAWDASRRLLAAAIEVGRLRALAVTETALEGIEAEIEKTKNWRSSTGMRPATDTSKFAYVPPSGLREIEWHIREARRALAAREEVQG